VNLTEDIIVEDIIDNTIMLLTLPLVIMVWWQELAESWDRDRDCNPGILAYFSKTYVAIIISHVRVPDRGWTVSV